MIVVADTPQVFIPRDRVGEGRNSLTRRKHPPRWTPKVSYPLPDGKPRGMPENALPLLVVAAPLPGAVHASVLVGLLRPHPQVFPLGGWVLVWAI